MLKEFTTPIGKIAKQEAIQFCKPDTSLKNVVSSMKMSMIGSMLICEGVEVRGIITERDILQKIVGTNIDLDKSPVSNYMTANPVSVTEDTTVGQVITMMKKGRFRHIVVTDKTKKPVNIVSVKDIVGYICEAFNLS